MKINLRLLRIYLAKIYPPRYNLASIIKFLVHRHAPPLDPPMILAVNSLKIQADFVDSLEMSTGLLLKGHTCKEPTRPLFLQQYQRRNGAQVLVVTNKPSVNEIYKCRSLKAHSFICNDQDLWNGACYLKSKNRCAKETHLF